MYHPPPIPTRKMMAFIDGENLLARFQSMIECGAVVKSPNGAITYEKDRFVWHTESIVAPMHLVIRATYYTSVGAGFFDDVNQKVKKLEFWVQNNAALPKTLTPSIFPKKKHSKSKGVDIRLCVDALTHAFQRNVDTVYLISGDADFLPLIEEIKRAGCQVHLAAFSSGLSDKLKLAVDHYVELDDKYFDPLPSGFEHAEPKKHKLKAVEALSDFILCPGCSKRALDEKSFDALGPRDVPTED
jgi:uncharacterized LabA/DUF88 family protein